MSQNVLDSYLVRLGAVVDSGSWTKFNVTLKDAEKLVGSFTGTAVSQFFKVEASLIGLFTAAGLGIIGLADKTAMADQQYRLFGMRMLMTKESARAMQMSMDELGASLDEIAYDPELNRRFQALYEQNIQLGKSLGGNFDSNMRGIRDIKMEYSKFGKELEFLSAGAVNMLFEKLGYGDGGVLNALEDLNNWFVSTVPSIADSISTGLVPVWGDFLDVTKATKDILKELGHEFTYTVGIISGDKSLETETTSFKQFATAVGDVTGAISDFTRAQLVAIKVGVDFIGLIVEGIGKHKMPNFTQHIDKSGNTTFDLWGDGHQSSFDSYTDNLLKGAGVLPSKGTSKSVVSSSSDIISAVKRASLKTGVPEDLIFAQWSLETNGFTNKTGNDRNNLGGIKIPGTLISKKFGSLSDFADSYSDLINRNFSGAGKTQTPADFAHALKNGRIGSYFGNDSESDYAAGIDRYKRLYDSASGSSDVNIEQLHIHVPHDLPKEQWSRFVHESTKDLIDKNTKNTISQTAAGSYF